jgi:large subunit ribosomal protein L18
MGGMRQKLVGREKRRRRVRRGVFGIAERPRLNVFRSLRHVYAQLINDESGLTVVSVSSMTPEIRSAVKSGASREAARAVGKLLGEKAKAAGIAKAVFDRAGYKYHGRVKELADGAREGGLQF